MLKISTIVVALLSSIVPVSAQVMWAPFMANQNFSSGWRILPVGAGGFLTGLSISNDGTYVVRNDTYGAYLWNASAISPVGTTGSWQQLVTTNSLPASMVSQAMGLQSGVYELVVAPNNSNVMYMMGNHVAGFGGASGTDMTVYSSANKGVSWAISGFSPVSTSGGQFSNSFRTWNNKMAVDPANSNNLYVGTPVSSLFYSSDGANTFNAANGVPAGAANGAGNTGICFNPTNSNEVFAASYGNGVYHTTSGYTGFSGPLTNGTGPGASNVFSGACDGSGNYFAVSQSPQDLWKWNGTIWAKKITGGGGPDTNVVGVAVDPQNTAHVIAITANGNLNESTDNGSTWSGWSHTSGPNNANNFTYTGDITWQSIITGNIQGNPQFDPANNKKLYVIAANNFYVATWSGAITTSTDVAIASQGRGIEQLTVNRVVSSQTGQVVMGAWDHPVWYKTNLGTPSFPSTFYQGDVNVVAAWSIDYASNDPTFMVCLCDQAGEGSGSKMYHAKTTNGGVNWTNIASNFTAYTTAGGTVAVSTTSEFVITSANNQPQFTTDSGSTFTGVNLPGVSSYSSPSTGSSGAGDIYILADRVNANQFTIFLKNNGFYTSNGNTDLSSTAVWTKKSSTSIGALHQIKPVPGQANHLWLIAGTTGSAGDLGSPNSGTMDVGTGLQYSTDGGATFTKLTNMSLPSSLGFGPTVAGYPAMYTQGWLFVESLTSNTIGTGNFNFTVTCGNTILPGSSIHVNSFGHGDLFGTVTAYNNSGPCVVSTNITTATGSGTESDWTVGVYGIWQTTSGETATPAWTELTTFPNGIFGQSVDIDGDKTTLGQVYITVAGAGYMWRH